MIAKVRHILGLIRNFIVNIFNIFPIQDAIIFESNPDFNDEGFWVCKKFMDEKADEKFKIYWILKERSLNGMPDEWKGRIDFIYLYPKNIFEWVKKYYVLHTSKVILDSCLFVNKSRRKQFRLFLFHCMPIKKVDKYIRDAGKFDYFSVGSSYFIPYYKSLGISENKLMYFGMARNDQLKEKSGNLQKIYDIGKYRNVVIWMPTYRQHVSSSNACNIEYNKNNKTGMPVLKEKEDFDYINEILVQNSILLIIKPHQSQNLDFMNVEKYSNIQVLTTSELEERNIQLYSILAETDGLITDYSSIYIDYLLLNKPIAVTIDDYEEYGHKVGFVMKDFMEEIQSYKISRLDEFEHFLINIDNPEILKCQGDALTRFHNVMDFKSSDRIYDFVMSKIS